MPFNPKKFKELFNCTQCGECCKGYGGTFLSQTDIKNISEHLNISVGEFISNYCQTSGGKPLLAKGENGFCIFWDKICTIHSIKPSMCRKWPFIKSVLVDVGNWRAMASCCPGMEPNAADDEILKAVQYYLDNSS